MKSGFVTIIGRPNAGKSTLLNNILGTKISIMSDKPQTTRNCISGIYTNKEIQIIFLDTPGIHKPKHKLGEFMVNIAEDTIKNVDLVYYMVDVTTDFGRGDQYIIDRLASSKTPVILILNKIDLMPHDKVLEIINFWKDKAVFAEIFPLSALKGENVDRLIATTSTYLEEGPMYYPEDTITDQPERVVISELIREKVLHLTREEIPHSVAVIIESMEKRSNGKVFIVATIYVERDSQKKIIIGKGGELLKKVGTLARGDIERLLGERVYLDLWIKVKKDWRNKDSLLRNFGYDKTQI
ncbi:GTP-binding protein Era [Desulfonispora thiosulfatigenes DSM 11270]|uniref:GTPase Era n=1 Tax=Desulfonispora thiosulfatigenes DSM 11270 TaxID=656914 RepID=A0A1W1VC14_DESTI|nr:GTPase Era [Desulfonispora thiosulfatigenes]SMB91007.1 GTP-binding protein Era [Desulfonispora thiosulfatigenes DSM 11270]